MNDRHSNQEIEVVTKDGEIVSGLPAGYEGADAVTSTLAAALTRAEIEQQIVTARSMPRSITRAVENIIGLATLDEESAEECIYALPRAGKAIRGPSIRLAEIIQACFGNCRSGTRVVHVDRFEKYVEAEGIFHDLETNSSSTSRVRRRISDRHGKLLSEDMIIVTGNAACAIAKRNAILAGVPKAVWRKAYAEVERVIAGDVQTLVARRDRALAKFARYGVVPEQVFAALGVGGVDDVKVEHLPMLTGMFAALKSGESNVEEMFTKVEKVAGKGIGAKLDTLANGGEKVDAPAQGAQAAGPGQQATSAEPGPSAATQASPAKGEEAAGAKPAEAGAVSPQDSQAAPASSTTQAAATEKPKEEAKPATATATAAAAAPATAAPAQAAEASKPNGSLPVAAKTGLKRLHDDIDSKAISKKKVETYFNEFVKANELQPGEVIFVAAEKIRDAHFARVAGDSSPAETAAAVGRVLA